MVRLACALLAIAGIPAPAVAGEAIRTRTAMPFTLGPETTVITKPLREDGSPDYDRVLADPRVQGAAMQPNGVDLLRLALPIRTPFFYGLRPPSTIERMTRINQRLGVVLLGANGMPRWYRAPALTHMPNAYGPAGVFSDDDDDEPSLRNVHRDVWTAQAHPELAAWTTRNEGALEVARAAGRRKHWWFREFDTFSSGCMDGLGDLFVATVNLRWGEGQYGEAVEVLCDLYRLGNAYWAAGRWYDSRADRTIATANDIVRGLLSRPGGTAREWEALAAAARSSRGVRERRSIEWQRGRLMALRRIVRCARDPDELDSLLIRDFVTDMRMGVEILSHRQKVWRKWLSTEDAKRADMDYILRAANGQIDRVVGIRRMATYRERKEALDGLDRECEEIESLLEPGEDDGYRPSLVRAAKKAGVSTETMFLAGHVRVDALRWRTHRIERELMCDLVEPQASIGTALRAYAATHGEYPRTLDSLPRDAVPARVIDGYSGTPMEYRRLADGRCQLQVPPRLNGDEWPWWPGTVTLPSPKASEGAAKPTAGS